ncbi:DUF6924 domain-containing protein [Rhodococcus sp. NPDC058505]|uniref:DUF6924 domain-containing protein n=1 Tax=unclassified Rhodococcus (in: high G+C Gram-positive bacteria) TaxID=192944 RepID=UPI00366600A1
MDRQLPEGLSLLVRTDFSDDALWREVLRSTVNEDEDEDEYYPQFTVVDDPQFEGLTIGGLLKVARPDQSYVFVADSRTMTDPEHPLLVVDTGRESTGHVRGQSVRVTQPVIEAVESNLSIANMDFVDFVQAAEADGVYRGADLRTKQPEVQSVALSVVRDAVARQSGDPLFARLLHDIDSGEISGTTIPVTLDFDMDKYRENTRKPIDVDVWRAEGKEEFLQAISEVPRASTFRLTAYGRFIWDVVAAPATLEPVAAYKMVRTVDSE